MWVKNQKTCHFDFVNTAKVPPSKNFPICPEVSPKLIELLQVSRPFSESSNKIWLSDLHESEVNPRTLYCTSNVA